MMISSIARAAERAESLDPIANRLVAWIHRCTSDERVKNLLSGVAIGHPLHPILSDLPIGLLTSASAVDLADGTVVRGPATIPQPAFDTRVLQGQVEVKIRGHA